MLKSGTSVLVDGRGLPSFPGGKMLRLEIYLRAVEPKQYWRNYEHFISWISIKKKDFPRWRV